MKEARILKQFEECDRILALEDEFPFEKGYGIVTEHCNCKGNLINNIH